MLVSRARLSVALAFSTALTLAACTTPNAGPTHVTRFHLNQQIATGQIAVEPSPGQDANSLEFANYAAPVAAELTRIGFTQVPTLAASELVAVVDVQRASRNGPPRGPAFSLGIGGASFGRHSGVGGGVGVPIGRPKPTEIVGTQLSVQIKRRSDGTVIWEGRAVGEARGGAAESDPGATAARLAHALFVGFPGESGRTVTVK